MSHKFTQKQIKEESNSVVRWLMRWANQEAQNYDSGVTGVLEDVRKGGIGSGFVTPLIYTQDVHSFYKRNCLAVAELIEEFEDSTGESVQRNSNTEHLDGPTFRVWLAVELACDKLLVCE